MSPRILIVLIAAALWSCTSNEETVPRSETPQVITDQVTDQMVAACAADSDILRIVPSDLDDPARRVATVESSLAAMAIEEGFDTHPKYGSMLTAGMENFRRDLILAEIGDSTEEEVREFFEANRAFLAPPTPRRLWAIFTESGPMPTSDLRDASRARILEAAAHLASGEEFAAVARALGQGPSSQNGGDFGMVTPRDLPGSTREIIWALAENEVSAPMELSHGYAIFQTTDWTDHDEPQFEDLRESITGILRNEKLTAHRQAWLSGIRFEAPNFDPTEAVSPDTVIMALGDESWAEADLTNWIEENTVATPTTEERAGHRNDFRNRIADEAYFGNYQSDDEEWFEARMTARRNHYLTGYFIDWVLESNLPDDDALQVLLDSHQQDIPFATERLVTSIVIPLIPGPGEEGLAEYYLVERAQAQMDEAQRRMEEGESFEDVAADYAQHLGQSEDGDMGWIREPSRPLFDLPLADTVVGDITEPRAIALRMVMHHVRDMRTTALDDVRDTLLNLWRGKAAGLAFANLCAAADGDQTPDWVGLIEDAASDPSAAFE